MVEEKTAATKEGALDFDKTFLHERQLFVFDKRRKKDGTRSKKDRSGTGRESNLQLAETGVA